MKYQKLNILQTSALLFCLLNKISSAFEFPSAKEIFQSTLDIYKYPYYINFLPEKKLELTHNMKRKRRSSTINQEWKHNVTTAEDFILENLEITNKYRAIHGVAPLELDYKLCSESEEWAMELVRRSEEKGSPVLLHSWKFETGENLYAERTMKNYSVKGIRVATKWYSQCREHTWNPNFFSSNSARFTQMIWKDTERMGIAQATSEKQRFTVVVARYLPCGNWGYHKSFEENVFPQTRLKDGITKCYKHKKAENISTLQIAFPKRPTKPNNILLSASTKNESESKDALLIDNEEEIVTSTTASETKSTEEYPESEEYVYSYEEDVKVSHNVSKPSSTTQAPKGRALPLAKNDSAPDLVQKEEKHKDKKASIHSDNKYSTKKNVKRGKKKAETKIEANDKAKTKESSKSEDKSKEDNSSSTKDKKNHSSGTDDEKKQKDTDDKEKSEETEANDEKEKKEETTETSENEIREKKNVRSDSQNKNTKEKHERDDKESKTKQKHRDKKKVKIVNKAKNPSSATNSSHHNKKQDKNKDKNEATTVSSKKIEETAKVSKSETTTNKNHVKDHKTVKQRK